MRRCVPITIVSVLIHQDNKTYSWINSNGCFHAALNDKHTGCGSADSFIII
jgi:hypothetical protein